VDANRSFVSEFLTSGGWEEQRPSTWELGKWANGTKQSRCVTCVVREKDYVSQTRCAREKTRSFQSCILPLFSNESLCKKTIDMKIRCTYKFIFTQIQIISIGKVFHENSFEKRHKVTRKWPSGQSVVHGFFSPIKTQK